MNESEARALIVRLAAGYPSAKLQQANVDLYAEMLLDFSAEETYHAVNEILSSGGDFFPAIGRIRETIAARRLDAPPPEAAFAQAISSGPRHALVQEAKRRVGDEWHWRETSSTKLRDAFRGAYSEVFRSAVLAIAAPESSGMRELGAAPPEIEP